MSSAGWADGHGYVITAEAAAHAHLIKKIGHTYKYYLTHFGKEIITPGLKLRELVLIPQLAFGHTH